MATKCISPGDWVIFRMTKFSERPGPRAKHVSPAPKGESYCYTVDKFWIVERVEPDGTLVLKTRRGKQHSVAPGDPRMRLANWWERWRYRSRYEAILSGDGTVEDAPPVKSRQPDNKAKTLVY